MWLAKRNNDRLPIFFKSKNETTEPNTKMMAEVQLCSQYELNKLRLEINVENSKADMLQN